MHVLWPKTKTIICIKFLLVCLDINRICLVLDEYKYASPLNKQVYLKIHEVQHSVCTQHQGQQSVCTQHQGQHSVCTYQGQHIICTQHQGQQFFHTWRATQCTVFAHNTKDSTEFALNIMGSIVFTHIKNNTVFTHIKSNTVFALNIKATQLHSTPKSVLCLHSLSRTHSAWTQRQRQHSFYTQYQSQHCVCIQHQGQPCVCTQHQHWNALALRLHNNGSYNVRTKLSWTCRKHARKTAKLSVGAFIIMHFWWVDRGGGLWLEEKKKEWDVRQGNYVSSGL